VLIGCCALALAGCGDSGGGDEDDVKESAELFFAKKEPRGCDVQTDRFLKNSEDEADLGTARRNCRKDEAEGPSKELSDVGLEPTRGAEVSDIAIDGGKATAKATQQGGDLDGQVIDVTLVKHASRWKIDRLDGLEINDALRQKIDGALGRFLGQSFRDNVRADRVQPVTDCVLARGRQSFPNERLAARFEGQLPPGTLSKAFEEAARGCLTEADVAKGDKTVSGTGYEIGVPGGWRNVTRSANNKQLDLLLSKAAATVNVVRETSLPAGITLEQYFEAGRARAGVELPRTPKPATLGGDDAITYTFPHEVQGRKLRQRQVVAIRDGVAYVVTLTAREAGFADQSKDFDAILASWRWK
jgi:DcrB-like protein